MRVVMTYGVAAVLMCAAMAIAADEPEVSQAPATAPATQPLKIAGLPAQWLASPSAFQTENLQGRLWVLGVLEPWSSRSLQAVSMLADLEKTWYAKGVPAYLVTTAPLDQALTKEVIDKLSHLPITVPVGTGSPLPMLLGLDPLPQVYLVGPEQTVVWSGPVWRLSDVLPEYYANLTEGGLSHTRTNELTNRLTRASAALEHKEYFLAVGLASLVAQATPPNHALHEQAQRLLDTLSAIGSRMLVEAEQLISQKHVAEGFDRLQTVSEQFYGAEPGKKAIQAIERLRQNNAQWAEVARQQDETSARHTLELAQAAAAQQQYAAAQRYYQLILDLYPRTQAVRQARQGLSRLHSGAAASQLAEQQAEPAAPVMLNLAARYVQMGRNEQARRYYEQVIQQAGGTVYAEQARKALQGLPADAPATQEER